MRYISSPAPSSCSFLHRMAQVNIFQLLDIYTLTHEHSGSGSSWNVKIGVNKSRSLFMSVNLMECMMGKGELF